MFSASVRKFISVMIIWMFVCKSGELRELSEIKKTADSILFVIFFNFLFNIIYCEPRTILLYWLNNRAISKFRNSIRNILLTAIISEVNILTRVSKMFTTVYKSTIIRVKRKNSTYFCCRKFQLNKICDFLNDVIFWLLAYKMHFFNLFCKIWQRRY